MSTKRIQVGRARNRITPEVLELFDRVMECEIHGDDDYDQRHRLWEVLDVKPWDASPCFAFGDARSG